MGLTAAQLLAISAILEVRLGRNHPLLASVDKARKEQSVIESDTQKKAAHEAVLVTPSLPAGLAINELSKEFG